VKTYYAKVNYDGEQLTAFKVMGENEAIAHQNATKEIEIRFINIHNYRIELEEL
jgi:hypothetical protein